MGELHSGIEFMPLSKRVGEEKAIEYIAKAGFNAWDYTMHQYVSIDWKNFCVSNVKEQLMPQTYIKYAKLYRQVADDNGIVCCQSHAPFPVDVKGMEEYIIRALECTAIVGAKYCIVHPANNRTPKENALAYARLLPYAKSFGVKMACENMWNWNEQEHHARFASCATAKDFLDNLQEVNDEYLVACLDIGHAEMKGAGDNAVDMIYALNKHLQCLHIHDNDLVHDSHKIPFTMSIDYPPICKALKDIGYGGYYSLECTQAFDGVPDSEIYETVVKMKSAIDRFCDLVEKS